MQTLVISLILSILFSIFYILYSWRYKKHIENLNIKTKEEKSTVPRQDVVRKGDVMKEKLKQISNLIADTEKFIEEEVKEKIKLMEQHTESFETELIEKGGKQYRLTTAGLLSAMPKTKEELLNDLQNLSETLEKLEELDIEIGPEKPVDIGKGIYYEKMSRRFLKIIQENKLNLKNLIPIHQLKYHLFSNIKNIKNDDVLPILHLMKETKLITDLIEINPTFYFISIIGTDLEFTAPEKVVLSFTYDEDKLTIEKLLELTQWDYQYAYNAVKSLSEKGVVEVVSDRIIVYPYQNEDEKNSWNKVIDSNIQTEKVREEEKLRRGMELKRKLKAKIAETKKISDFKVDKDIITEEQADTVVNDETNLPKIKFDKKPSVKTLPKKDSTRNIESKPKESELNEEISQRILRYHEKFSILNGGITQYEKIQEYIRKKYPKVKKEVIISTIRQLMELNLVHSSIVLDDYEIFLFKEINLNQREQKFILSMINKPPMTKKDVIEILDWMEKTVLKTMKKLQEKGILRIESDKIIIPGIIQE